MPGSNAGTLGIEHKLPKTNCDTPGTLVANAQNSLVVGNHCNPNVTMPVAAKYLLGVMNITRVDMNPVGSTEHGGILLAGKPHSGGVNYFHEAWDISGNNGMRQGCIPVKQGTHIDVAFNVIFFFMYLFQAVFNLLG